MKIEKEWLCKFINYYNYFEFNYLKSLDLHEKILNWILKI
jgi:hypothetical protein